MRENEWGNKTDGNSVENSGTITIQAEGTG
jgi:hypothetical protein